MKRALKIVGLLLLVALTVTMFAACSDKPSYRISNISYDPVRKILDWSDNSDASSWVVDINGKEKKTSSSELEYDAGNQDFTFSIEGLHNKKGHDDNPRASGTMKYIGTPTNLRVENGKLTWDVVPGASYYEVYNFDSSYSSSSTNSIEIPSGSFSFTVKACGNSYYYSYQSAAFVGTVLQAPSSLSYENGVLKWNAVDGADYYTVKINGTAYTANTNSYSYAGTAADFTVSVAAGANGENVYESAPLEKTCYYLSAVNDFDFDEEGNLIWETIPNADGYKVKINGETHDVTETLFSDVKLDTPYVVTVTPYTSKMSYVAPAVEYRFEKLSPVKNVAYDYKTGSITWDAHTRAMSYELIINGKSETVNGTSYDLGNPQMNLEIAVYALGGSENSKSYTATAKTYTYLPPVTGLALHTDGTLIWNPVQNAAGYIVSLNGTEKTASEPMFKDIGYDTEYTVTVVPYTTEDSYSSTPTEFTFTKLSEVKNTVFDAKTNKITWTAHSKAASYELIYNGKTEKIETGTSFTIPQRLSQDLEFKVYAIGEGTNSRSYTAKDMKYTYIEPAKNITVRDGKLIWDGSEKATGYTLAFYGKSDEKISKNEYTGFTTGEQHRVTITPYGKDEYCFSYPSAEFTFKVLPSPTLSYAQGGVVKWNSNEAATGYVVVVTKDGKDFKTETLGATELTYSNTYSEAGTYSITVKATSSSNNVYDSAYSKAFEIVRLGAPEGHEILNDPEKIDTLEVSLNAVKGASGYSISVNGAHIKNSASAKFALDLLSLSENNDEVVFNISINVIGTTTTSSPVYLDATQPYTIVIRRLATPQNVQFSGTTLTWDSVANTSKYLVSVDGKKEVATTTSFTLSNLAPGSHVIKVQAMADTENVMSSRYSTALNVTKLAKVTGVTLTTTQSGATQVKWTAVTGATSYALKLGQTEHNVGNVNAFVLTDYLGAITEGSGMQITVFAKGNGSTSIDSEPSDTKTITRFARPTNVAVTGDKIVWSDCSVDSVKASNYIVSINGEEVNATGTSFSTADLPADTYVIKVMAKGDSVNTLDSQYSSVLNVTKLATVTDIAGEAGSNKLTWSAVDGAQEYVVTIDGETFYKSGTEMTLDFSKAGTHSIKIYARSNDPNVIASTVATKTLQVKALTKPVFAEDITDATGKFTVTQSGYSFIVEATVPVEALPDGVVQYRFIVNGTYAQELDLNIYTQNGVMEEVDYDIQVQYLVNCFGEDGNYYINSDPSAIKTMVYDPFAESAVASTEESSEEE